MRCPYLDIFGNKKQLGDSNFQDFVALSFRSPLLGNTIALARLDMSAGEVGSTVEIDKLDGHQKRIAATVVGFPHYDPTKSRVRG